jgi:protein-tyrosine phosphatase
MENSTKKIWFEGANNFRDMGGYPLQCGGFTRDGVLFRSDHLASLTDTDQKILLDLGVRTVIDFRRSEEKAKAENRIDHEHIKLLHLPVESKGADTRSLRQAIEEGGMSPERARSFLIEANEQFVREFTHVFRDYVHLLLDESNYPMVFHCTAGKDRTGFAAALTLFILGASEEVVMYDYLATNHLIADYVEEMLEAIARRGNFNCSLDALRPIMRVEEAFLRSALSAIVEDYGNIATYIKEGLEFGPEKQAYVRELLINSGS